MRLAYAHFGITTPVLSVVISVFMLGLALGSWLGGLTVGPLTHRLKFSALIFYALAEAFIGIGALAAPALMTWGDRLLLTMGETNSTGYLFFSALVLLISLLPWCVCMGATFPLVMRFVKEVDKFQNESFSFLYMANVLGAVSGTLATAFLLVELLGFHGTLVLACVVNFLIALSALVWGFRVKPINAKEQRPVINRTGRVTSIVPAFLFMTGFTSMGMEVAWVRDFTPVMGNEIYAFSKLLATYLIATWVGSWLYRKHLANHKVLSIGWLTALLSVFPFLPVLLNDPTHYHSNFLALASLVPFCAALGYATPRFIDQWSEGDAKKGGRIYAWNILGCILGPLFVSYLMLPYIGAKEALLFLALPFIVFHFILESGRNITTKSWIAGVASLTCLLLGFFACGSYEEGWNLAKWDRYQLRRDHTATVLSYQTGLNKGLFINGIGVAYLTSVTKVMAHLPLALCPHPPKSCLVICFGMGTTFRSLTSWGIDTTAVELVPSVKEAFPFNFSDAYRVLARPNARVVIDDGRRFLQRTRQKFDVITLDPAPPVEAAGSSLLYSDGFYTAVKNRLADGGIVQQWIPGGEPPIQQAFARSFVNAFPYVIALHSFEDWGTHLIGSMTPIDLPTTKVLASRIPKPAQADLNEWMASKDTENFLKLILSKQVSVQSLLNQDERIAITDDHPFNEYYALRRTFPAIFKY